MQPSSIHPRPTCRIGWCGFRTWLQWGVPGLVPGGLRNAFQHGEPCLPEDLSRQAKPNARNRLLSQTVRTDWVTYAEPPTKGPARVLKHVVLVCLTLSGFRTSVHHKRPSCT